MAWTKILLAGDAAELEATSTPIAVGTTAATGSGTTASKYDHVHVLGTGSINAAGLFAAGVVNAAAMGADSVGASELIESESYSMAKLTLTGADPGSEIVLTPKISSASVVEGTVFYDSDDNHLYVYVV